MRLLTPSIESLAKRRDVPGLVKRLDQKDRGPAQQALISIGEPAVRALVQALGTQRGSAASSVLAEIGELALPALVGLITNGDESKVAEAGTTIRSMRERGVLLSGEVIAPLLQIKGGGLAVARTRHLAASNAVGTLSASEEEELILPGQEEDPLRTLTGHIGWVNGCAVSPDGSWIVSASGDKTLKIWDPASGDCLRTLTGHTGWVNGCAVSPDGTWIVSASGDRSLKVWDAASGDCLRTLTDHINSATRCAVSPDGTWILSASRDRNLKVWDAASGECLRTLTDHRDRIEGCAISPDGHSVVSASWDKSLKVWDTESWRKRG